MASSRTSQLVELLGESHVLDDRTDRLAYNADCSPRGIILARGGRVEAHRPAAVVQPEDEEGLQKLVDWARRTETALVPYGAGSGVCRGALADGESVIVDLKRFDAIREVDDQDLTIRVGAGVIGMHLERELQRRGLTMGHYPSSLYCSSVGGYLAARSAGQYSSRYGKIEDMVESVRAVTGRGEVVESAPDATAAAPGGDVEVGGPNPTQLFVGSEGTLGLITGATLQVEPAPETASYRGYRFEELETALEAIREVMQAGLRPAVVRLYDPLDTLIKGGGGPEGESLREQVASLLPEGVTEGLEEVAGAIRDALARRVIGAPALTNALADQVASSMLLVVGFEGTGPVAEREAAVAHEMLVEGGAEDLGPEPGRRWREGRFDVSYKQSPLFATGAFVDTMEISTTWSNLEHLYRRVRAALAEHAVVLAHFSHVYPEGSSIYFTFAGYAPGTERSLEVYRNAWRAGLDAVVEAGGSVTHHHGVGELKVDWVEADHVGGEQQFEALEAAFDPDGIMNPGKVYE